MRNDPRQFVLDVFHDPSVRRPDRPERLFLGILADMEAARHAVARRSEFLGGDCTGWSPVKHLHVSLHHVRDDWRVREKYVFAAGRAASAVSMAPFEMTFRFIGSFPGAPAVNGKPPRRPLVLLGEGEEVFEFHRMLGAGMRAQGLRAAELFRPHMTLAYGPEMFPRQAIEPFRLTVAEFTLIHSHRGLSQYDSLDRWPLTRPCRCS